MTTTARLKLIYKRLFARFGPQHWWPGDTPFEIIVGAILTQNTNWTNVEKAIVNLKRARRLSPQGLKSVSRKRLAALIRPSGYYNIKARRLKNFIAFLFRAYGGRLDRMARIPLADLREQVLSVTGIGPETADSILLYAFGKPVFVVDAYTRRVLSRHGIVSPSADYHAIQRLFMDRLDPDPRFFNEYHALFVALGKNFCKTRPLCEVCPLHIKALPAVGR